MWSAADKLRANSDLKFSEYATPVLGLIFLKFADNNYRRHETEIHAEYTKLKGSRREKKISDIAIEKCGFYLPDHARYEHLLKLRPRVIPGEMRQCVLPDARLREPWQEVGGLSVFATQRKSIG